MGRMTRLIDYGAWASSRSDPSKRRTWPLRRAGWRFDRASGAWDGPDGERLTVSFLGFAILEREDADWEHPGTGYGTQWHGGRYGMPLPDASTATGGPAWPSCSPGTPSRSRI